MNLPSRWHWSRWIVKAPKSKAPKARCCTPIYNYSAVAYVPNGKFLADLHIRAESPDGRLWTVELTLPHVFKIVVHGTKARAKLVRAAEVAAIAAGWVRDRDPSPRRK